MINSKYVFFLLLFAPFLFYGCTLMSRNVYWNDFDIHTQKRVIEDKSVNERAKLVYFGKDFISDDEDSFVLLEEITSFNQGKYINAFYFYIFSEICQSADGVIAETLGYYCLCSLDNSTQYNLYGLKKNYSLLHKYGELIAYELNQSEESIKKYHLLKDRMQYICVCDPKLKEVSDTLQNIIEEKCTIMAKE